MKQNVKLPPKTNLEKIDGFTQKVIFIAVAVGAIALLLVCVGIGTPNWESSYISIGSGAYAQLGTANFFYTCSFTNGTYNNCTSRTTNLTNYPRYTSTAPWMTDYNLRMQNAAGLCIVGIVFLFFGIVITLLMAFISFSLWLNLLSPILIFCACLFMLAGMAEGVRYLLFNDYAANLYQAGHLLTMLTLLISAFAAGRIHLVRMKEEQEAEAKKKAIPIIITTPMMPKTTTVAKPPAK